MTGDNTTTANDIAIQLRDALLSKADDIREAEVRFDDILRQAGRQMEKAEQDMNRNIGNGMSEQEAFDGYKEMMNKIEVGIKEQVQTLEGEYSKKYPSSTESDSF